MSGPAGGSGSRLPVLAVALLLLVVTGSVASAEETASPPVQVRVEAAGPEGLAGLVLLGTVEAGTAVQVMAVGAPPGTTAVIQRGTCGATGATLVALLGDLGAGGQVQTVVPLDLGRLTDGSHAVVFHPGLDLSTRLGCGDIPAVEAPAPSGAPVPPTGPDAPAGDSFTSERFGYTVAWDETWQRLEVAPQEDVELLSLGDSVASVHLSAYEGHDGDALACRADWEGRVMEALAAGRITGLVLAAGPGGTPIAWGDDALARGGYRYTLTLEGQAPLDQVDVFECRRLSSTAVLTLVLVSPAEAFEDQLARFEALVAGIAMPSLPQPPIESPQAPTPEPTPVPTPEPAPTPAPTPTGDPACIGAAEWMTRTSERLDRIDALMAEADKIAGRMDLAGYTAAVASLEGQLYDMIARQTQEPVPLIAAEANAKVVTAYEVLADAAAQLLDAFATGTDLAAYNRAVARVQEAVELMTDARRDIGQIKGRCG